MSAAQNLASSLPQTSAISLDVSRSIDLDREIQAHNLVISLVPYIYHSTVIKLAIKNKVNVLTTSYVSPAIKELENAAKEAGIVILNEVGLVDFQVIFTHLGPRLESKDIFWEQIGPFTPVRCSITQALGSKKQC